jgi:hypothetical protein
VQVQRRIFWALPVLAFLAAVLIFIIVQFDPERSKSVLGWLGADFYYPRWVVYVGDHTMMWSTGIADCAIAVACLVISVCFWRRRRAQITFNSESIVLFSYVFLSVGLTHAVITFAFYSGVYLLDLMVRSAAAAMCIVTSGYVARALLRPYE